MGGTGPICLLQFGAPLEISNTFFKIINYCHVRESFHISGEFVSSEKLCFFAFILFFIFFSGDHILLAIQILLARGKSEHSHESVSLHV